MASPLYNLSQTRGVRVIELRLPLSMDVIIFDQLNSELVSEVANHPGDYLIDLAQTDYVGSAVLGLLVNLRSKIRTGGGELVLCCLSPRILEIFRIGALERLFTIAPTRDAAVELLGR